MSNSKKNLDEEYLQILREMASLAHNKQCFDCNQRGPTYINMTIGSFVCMTCSGLLRGLNPPHRVKSISMASFTAEEMDFIRSRGNDFCKKVWLVQQQNSRPFSQFDTKDEHRIRDTMSDKYEKKRWYKAPLEAMHEEARKQNATGTSNIKNSTVKPLSSMIGNSPPILSSPDYQVSRPPLVQQSSSVQRPAGVGSILLAPGAQFTSSLASPSSPNTRSPSDKSVKPANVDLLADLGGDSFVSPSPSQQFGDFAMFNSTQIATPTASTPLQPVTQSVVTSPPPLAAAAAADKYSALAELDDVFSSAASATKVNWNASQITSGSRNSGSWAASPSAGLPPDSPFGAPAAGIPGGNLFGGNASSPCAPSAMYNPFGAGMIVPPGYGQPQPGFGQFGHTPGAIGVGYGQFCAVPAGVQYGYLQGPGMTGSVWGTKVSPHPSMTVSPLPQPVGGGGGWSQPSSNPNPFLNTSPNNQNMLNPFL